MPDTGEQPDKQAPASSSDSAPKAPPTPSQGGSAPAPQAPPPSADSKPPGQGGGNGPGPAEDRTLIDSIADLLQVIVDWLRQEAESTVKNKVVLPLQRLGLTMFMAQMAVTLVLIGAIFMAIASLMLLAEWVGWIAALYIVGGVLAIIALILASISGKWWQK